MGVRRVVPDLVTDRLEETRAFYEQVLGLEVGMDMGWIVTLVSPENRTAQVTLFRPGQRVDPAVTIEVSDVDAVHDAAVRSGADVVYPLTDEEWGVRRFFVRDPSGTVVNVMAHVG
jgi:predicted enzyme related to lactoylglutathione lyase